MKTLYIFLISLVILALFLLNSTSFNPNDSESEWVPLFNGEDFTNWVVPEGDGGHWKVIDGVIDYDAMSQAEGSKDLWTEKEYGDFILKINWRIKETPFINHRVPLILPDGTHKRDENGNEITLSIPDSDSGIYLRGQPKAQVNIWTWPIGSGEVYGYRMDRNMPPEVRAGVTPTMHADNHIGEWNSFVITMRDEYLTVVLNGHTVINGAHLPGVAEKGPIGLQHHGHKVDGEWASSPSLVQFRNIYIKEL